MVFAVFTYISLKYRDNHFLLLVTVIQEFKNSLSESEDSDLQSKRARRIKHCTLELSNSYELARWSGPERFYLCLALLSGPLRSIQLMSSPVTSGVASLEQARLSPYSISYVCRGAKIIIIKYTGLLSN